MEIGVKNKIFTKTSTSDAHLYSNQDLRKLLVPIIVEQLLSSLMGTADTMMVSNVALPPFLQYPSWIPSIF